VNLDRDEVFMALCSMVVIFALFMVVAMGLSSVAYAGARPHNLAVDCVPYYCCEPLDMPSENSRGVPLTGASLSLWIASGKPNQVVARAVCLAGKKHA
jgi:hypothetical protein